MINLLERLRQSLAPADAAVNLAVLRIAVGAVLLTARDVWTAPEWAGLASGARVVPGGIGPLLAELPASRGAMWIAVALLAAAAVCGTVGLFSRTSFAIVAVLGVVVLGVPQLAGTVVHDHHLIWLAALLAASPCGDALSIDAWRARRRGVPPPADSAAYGLPIRLAWLLLGAVFFFPGLWKLVGGGLAWITSDNLANQMRWKWIQRGWVPPVRPDRYPVLCKVGAASVVAFEISFVFLLFVDRARRWAIAAALLFHAAGWLFLGILYSTLWPLYVVAFDWRRVAERLGASPEGSASRTRSLAPAAFTGALLLAGVIGWGAAGEMRAWPFACYPTFQHHAGPEMPVLAIELVHQDGRVTAIPIEALSESGDRTRAWGLAWSLAGVTGGPPRPAALRGAWETLRTRPSVAPLLRGARRVRFRAATISVDPDHHGPPRAGRVLYELALDPGGASVTSIPRERSGATTRSRSDRAASAR